MMLTHTLPITRMKSVSPEQQQQQAGPGPVFDRIEAEKLNKALESSQLMAKLEVGWRDKGHGEGKGG